jgi:hypothetical protein
MKSHGLLSRYLDAAMESAIIEQLADGTHGGHIDRCVGVVAFGRNAAQCQRELRATLEDWLLLGLKLDHRLPVIDGIDLNQEPHREPVESM